MINRARTIERYEPVRRTMRVLLNGVEKTFVYRGVRGQLEVWNELGDVDGVMRPVAQHMLPPGMDERKGTVKTSGSTYEIL
jgi:hypothetical protein